MALKMELIEALTSGAIGHNTKRGIEFSLTEFNIHFNDKLDTYKKAFLPCSTIEPGRTYATNTRFLYRVSRGVYCLHPNAVDAAYNEA